MRGRRISLTRTLKCPNLYVHLMEDDFSKWVFNEEKAPLLKGHWREVFKMPNQTPLDLEIGTGNGLHFAHRAQQHPERCLLGIELKYKPLVQSIRRALRAGSENARMIRYNACLLSELFAVGELNDVFIHFPDPWPRQSQWKHRLITPEFLKELHRLQRPGSRVVFKTDSRCYFDWTVERLKDSPYQVDQLTYNLHQEPAAESNFVTHFESLFVRQGLPIHQVVLRFNSEI